MSELVFTHHPRKVGIMKSHYLGAVEQMVPNEEWVFDSTQVYDQKDGKVSGMKPHGLWLSVDDDWKRWCDEDSGWELAPPHFFDVDLERMLVLTSAADILAFTKQYGIYESRSSGDPWVHKVRWEEVAEKYAGIMIAPYIWSMRLDMECSWYYCWDCASACVWDLSALTPVQVSA